MSMKLYKGLNFGQDLGPVISRPISAKLQKVYMGNNTNPLQGGYWTWTDDGRGNIDFWWNDGGSDGGSGDSGSGSNGGLTGSGRRYGPVLPPDLTYVDCPKWFKPCIKEMCCDEQQMKLICDAMRKVFTTPCLTLYPKLRAAMLAVYRNMLFTCPKDCDIISGTPRGPQFYAQHLSRPDRKGGVTHEMQVCFNHLKELSAADLVPFLFHEMIHAVNGTELDCVAITQNCFPNFFGNTIGDYEIMGMLNRQCCWTEDGVPGGEGYHFAIISNMTDWLPLEGYVVMFKPHDALLVTPETDTLKLWSRGQDWVNNIKKEMPKCGTVGDPTRKDNRKPTR